MSGPTAGTFISTILFGLATYFLVLIRVVKRSHLGPAPLVECMLYGGLHFLCQCGVTE